MLILDFFSYNGEPIVNFRLKYLYDYVDKFIIVESIYTYSGIKKDDYYYNKNRDLFKEFEEKIIFIPLDHYLPTGEDYMKIVNIINYVRYIDLKDALIAEIYLRDFIQKKLKEMFNEPYIIFVCDLDEIPKKSLYSYVKNDYDKLHNGIHIEMIHLLYGFNWKKKNNWFHQFITTDKGVNNNSLSLMRLTNHHTYYRNAGWHISHFLSIKDLIRKIESFAHTELNLDKYKQIEHLKNCIENGINIFDNNDLLIKTNEDELPDNYKEIDDEIRKTFFN